MSYLEIDTPHFKFCTTFVDDMRSFRQEPLVNASASYIKKKSDEFVKYVEQFMDYEFRDFEDKAVREMQITHDYFAGLLTLAQKREGTKKYNIKDIAKLLRHQRIDDMFYSLNDIIRDKEVSRMVIKAIVNNDVPHVTFDDKVVEPVEI